jgi:hypothetical protein
MLQEFEEGALFYDYAALTKYDYDALVEKYRDTQRAPEAYALVDDYFIVFPTPDASYVLEMKYYRQDTVLSAVGAGEENKWLKHAADWIMAKTGLAIARFIKDDGAAALFANDEQKATARVYKQHIDRAERNVERRMGDE